MLERFAIDFLIEPFGLVYYAESKSYYEWDCKTDTTLLDLNLLETLFFVFGDALVG